MILLSLLSNISLALSPETAYKWISTIPVSTESQKILARYSELSDEFSTELFAWSKTQLAKSASAALRTYQANGCSNSALFKIIDGKKIFASISEQEQLFTDSLFFIESSYCLEGISLDKAHTVYMSEEFRVSVMPQVISFSQKGTLSCSEGEGVFGILKASKYCFQNKEQRSNTSILIRNSFHSVEQGIDWQPYYFREEILLFVQMNDGVGLYRATFTRSDDLGTTSKYLLRNTVDSSQSNIRDQYYEWLTR